jgi:hypothetical protein
MYIHRRPLSRVVRRLLEVVVGAVPRHLDESAAIFVCADCLNLKSESCQRAESVSPPSRSCRTTESQGRDRPVLPLPPDQSQARTSPTKAHKQCSSRPRCSYSYYQSPKPTACLISVVPPSQARTKYKDNLIRAILRIIQTAQNPRHQLQQRQLMTAAAYLLTNLCCFLGPRKQPFLPTQRDSFTHVQSLSVRDWIKIHAAKMPVVQ